MLARSAGAIDAVVAVMRAHVGNSELMKPACWIVSNICSLNGAYSNAFFSCCCHVLTTYSTGENAVLAGRAGVIDALVGVMKAHADNASVLEPACASLNKICIDNGNAGDCDIRYDCLVDG